MDELRFSVPGMTCGHCVTAVRGGLERVPGAVDVDVDLATKRVVLRGDGVDRETVRAAVDEAGYEAVA
jgi:copper chaperone